MSIPTSPEIPCSPNSAPHTRALPDKRFVDVARGLDALVRVDLHVRAPHVRPCRSMLSSPMTAPMSIVARARTSTRRHRTAPARRACLPTNVSFHKTEWLTLALFPITQLSPSTV